MRLPPTLTVGGTQPRPPWALLPGVSLRSVAMCLSLPSSIFSFQLGLPCCFFPYGFLGLFLMFLTKYFPDLLCFPSNPSLYLCIAISGDAYPKPTAMTCKYAPRSSSQNGSCPLVHPVMLQGTEYPLGACPFDPFLDLTSLSFQLGYLVDFLADEDLLVGDGLSFVLLTFVSGKLADGYFGIAIDPLNDLSFRLDVVACGCALQCGGAAGSSSLSATVLANQDCGLAWFRPTMFVVFLFLFGPFGLCCLLLLASGRPSCPCVTVSL